MLCYAATILWQIHRYYGGIKLGAGGLTRAYGQAARECLRSAPKAVRVPQKLLTMDVPFDQLGAVHAVLNQAGVVEREEHYDAGGMVVDTCCVVDICPATFVWCSVFDVYASTLCLYTKCLCTCTPCVNVLYTMHQMCLHTMHQCVCIPTHRVSAYGGQACCS